MVASRSYRCRALASGGSCSLSFAAAILRGSSASLSMVGGGHGLVCSHPRRQRNCGSRDIMLASAVVPVRGSPLMSTGPDTGSCSISGWLLYQASTSSRLTSRRRKSSMTRESAAGSRSPSCSRLASRLSRPSRKSPGPKSVRLLSCSAVAISSSPVGYRRVLADISAPDEVRIELLGDAANAVAPMDAARAGDLATLAVVADRANGCTGYLVDYHLRVDAEQLTEVRRPLLNADGLIATPVDDRGRHACHTEQR